jgi:nitrate/nitrite transporter NarK
VFRVLTVACFFFLTITQTAYGIKLYHLHDWQILGRLSASKNLLIAVNIFLSISFGSRAVYQWIAMTFPQTHLPDVFLQVGSLANEQFPHLLLCLSPTPCF